MLAPASVRRFFGIPVVVLAAAVGCRDSVSPERLYLAELQDVSVPATAALADSVRVAFAYTLGCDRLEALEIRRTPESMAVAVWARAVRPDPLADCAFAASREELLLMPFSRAATFEVRFRQAGGDVVRPIVAP